MEGWRARRHRRHLARHKRAAAAARRPRKRRLPPCRGDKCRRRRRHHPQILTIAAACHGHCSPVRAWPPPSSLIQQYASSQVLLERGLPSDRGHTTAFDTVHRCTSPCQDATWPRPHVHNAALSEAQCRLRPPPAHTARARGTVLQRPIPAARAAMARISIAHVCMRDGSLFNTTKYIGGRTQAAAALPSPPRQAHWLRQRYSSSGTLSSLRGAQLQSSVLCTQRVNHACAARVVRASCRHRRRSPW